MSVCKSAANTTNNLIIYHFKCAIPFNHLYSKFQKLIAWKFAISLPVQFPQFTLGKMLAALQISSPLYLLLPVTWV